MAFPVADAPLLGGPGIRPAPFPRLTSFPAFAADVLGADVAAKLPDLADPWASLEDAAAAPGATFGALWSPGSFLHQPDQLTEISWEFPLL